MKKSKISKGPGGKLFTGLPAKNGVCDCDYPMVMRKGFGGDAQIVELRLCCLAKWVEAQSGLDIVTEYTEQ